MSKTKTQTQPRMKTNRDPKRSKAARSLTKTRRAQRSLKARYGSTHANGF